MLTTVFGSEHKNPNNYPFLETARPEAVGEYLVSRNFLEPGETVLRLDAAGRCARNLTLRVVTDQRSFVLKHFRAWPGPPGGERGMPAAADRFRSECQFHRSARIADCVRRSLPALLHQDTRTACAIFADAGETSDASSPLTTAESEAVAWFLISLHHHTESVPRDARYRSESVTTWHRDRLFAPDAAGLGDRRWRTRLLARGRHVRAAFADACAALEAGGTSLVHGDFGPWNWLRAGGRVHVVDAESSFFGPPEFDAGALLAGLLFTRQDRAAIAAAAAVLARGCFRYDVRLVAAFTGAHLCALLDGAVVARNASIRGATAAGLVRRISHAIASASLEPLVPRSAVRGARVRCAAA